MAKPSHDRVRNRAGLHVGSDLEDVSFPSLTLAEGLFRVGGTPTRNIAFPALESLGGGLYLVLSDPSVFQAPILQSIGAADMIDVEGESESLFITWTTTESTLALPQLESLEGALIITGNNAPVGLNLPLLGSMGDALLLGPDSGMTSLELGALEVVGGDFAIETNPGLEAIELPSLGTVGGAFTVMDNPLLPTSQVEALVEQVGEEDIGGPVTIEGNADLR